MLATAPSPLRGALLALALAAPAVVAAAGVRLDGPLEQGALVRGRTQPGATVALDGHEVRVSADGWFLLGFGRDAAAEAELRVIDPAGEVEVERLRIAAREYRVQRIDGLPPSKVSPSAADLERIRADAALIRVARRRDQARTDFLSGFEWPLRGRLSGVYGSQRIRNGEPRRPHSGVDIAAPAGTVVHAPADGEVSLAEQDMFFTGKTLMIDHGHGLASIFAHLSRILVRPGERVRRGQPIAEVGATGRVTGAHLHWGVSLLSTRLDPQSLVGEMAPAD